MRQIIIRSTHMWKKIMRIRNRAEGTFRQISPLSLPTNLNSVFGSKVYYTPKLQRFAFTEELAKYLRYLSRKDKIKNNDLRSLTEAILTEYGVIHGLEEHKLFKDNLDYSITRNYEFKPNDFSPFYGTVDYMVWLNSTHFVPVLFFEDHINAVAGLALAHANMALKSLARNNLITSGYSIVTTGQEWQMFKVYNTMKAQKTVVYEGRNRFRNIVEDHEMIQVIFGLIDESLETERQDVQVLKLAYEVIDDKRFMLEASSKQQAQKNSPISNFLLKYLKKKDESTSK